MRQSMKDGRFSRDFIITPKNMARIVIKHIFPSYCSHVVTDQKIHNCAPLHRMNPSKKCLSTAEVLEFISQGILWVTDNVHCISIFCLYYIDSGSTVFCVTDVHRFTITFFYENGFFIPDQCQMLR